MTPKKLLTPKQYSFVFVSFIFVLSWLPILAAPLMSPTYKTTILLVSYLLVNLTIILTHRIFTPIFDPENKN